MYEIRHVRDETTSRQWPVDFGWESRARQTERGAARVRHDAVQRDSWTVELEVSPVR